MDYKYIEQLLERYWECQTTLEEEAILRAFFRLEDVPASLLPYRQIFIEEDKMAGEHPERDFTGWVLNKGCKARRLTVMRHLRPLYRAAGAVAILFTIGGAAYQALQGGEDVARPQMAEGIAVDSLRQITAGQPQQQSAALVTPSSDTLKSYAR